VIDWIQGVVPYWHDEAIAEGGLQYINADWTLGAVLPRKVQVRGSFDSGFVIGTSFHHAAVGGRFTHVHFSGSPKFLQGHNLFGTSDVTRLVTLSVAKALGVYGRTVTAFDLNRWAKGDYKLSVLDITEMMDTGSDTNASAWMLAAGQHLRVKYRGGGKFDGGTLYVGKHSRRWAIKFYQKAEELQSRKKSHRLPDGIDRREDLLEYARGTVRAELRLYSMELKRLGLDTGLAWAKKDSREVWSSYMERIELTGNMVLRDKQVEELPQRLRGTYSLWSEGRDVPHLLSRATFYRHRKELLALGIDITTPPEKSGGHVVPLIRIIEARPKAIPQWAYGTPLLAA
jgi:II/X family phage/plasmid replication protein